MQSAITVVVPVYKVEKYLRKCVDSLLAQTYENYDIILVDDGSPDGCPKICDEYAKSNERVTAYHKENGGQGSARNYGVRRATAEWIVFVDSDDYVERTYLEDLERLRTAFDADMSIIRVECENNGKERSHAFEDFCADRKQALFEVYSNRKRIGVGPMGKLLRKEQHLECPFPDCFAEDMAWTYKIIDRCEKIAFGDYNDYHYIQREGGAMRSGISEWKYSVFDVCEEFAEYIEREHGELDILPALAYRASISSLIWHTPQMSWEDCRRIFNKCKTYFRKNLKKILRSSEVRVREKVYIGLLCTSPLFVKVLNKRKRR